MALEMYHYQLESNSAENITKIVSVYDPIHQRIYYFEGEYGVRSLRTYCLRVIRNEITLKRFPKADVLPLPRELIDDIKRLSILDFRVDPEHVSAENHEERTYPATCLVDATQVFIQIENHEAARQASDPAYILSIQCHNQICHIYKPTYTIVDLVERARHTAVGFSESFIWRSLKQITNIVKRANGLAHLHPRDLHMKDEHLFYRAPNKSTKDAEQLVSSTSDRFYEAPEVLMRRGPSEASSVWTIGAIAYELITLEPAFYDRAKNGDVMAVMMGIVQGGAPPDIEGRAHVYTDSLLQFVSRALLKDETDRPSLGEIINAATVGERLEECD